MSTTEPQAPASLTALKFEYLEDLWDEDVARQLDEPELLRYRSNLLGRDLRITNFGGGNTSSKLSQPDPLDSKMRTVLWVKGSGGDLGSIQRSGFAALYLDKVRALEQRYRGREHEDEMVPLYPLCTFGSPTAPPSIDTPLHAFLPFAHVDHLHPDWAIALAAAANGRERLQEFNQRFGHKLIWIPWQRPGFELALMIRKAVDQQPGCGGIVLGGHGLFTWGDTQRGCYLNTLTVIDDLGQFISAYVANAGEQLFGGMLYHPRADRHKVAVDIFPFLRGHVSAQSRLIGHYNDTPEVQRFINSRDAVQLAFLGTSCPDHFVRTKIRPLLVPWAPSGSNAELRAAVASSIADYRREYQAYYDSFKRPDSPLPRDPNPTVVLIPAIGMFSFGKSKAEARITGEFYINAIHVMEGATALCDGSALNEAARSPQESRSAGRASAVAKTRPAASDPALPEESASGGQVKAAVPLSDLPQAGAAAPSSAFKSFNNYVALPPSEAFNIEYWQLEEAKLRRQPPEKEFSRKVIVIFGAAHGIGRETARLAVERGAHVVVADRELDASATVQRELIASGGRDSAISVATDIGDRQSVRSAIRDAVASFGGVDILINTAALFIAPTDGRISDEQWRTLLNINVFGNYLLTDEVAAVFRDQGLTASVVLTSSANAVVPKAGSEAYDVGKAAVNHLVRELAIAFAPLTRVNGISPATVVAGSTMFPRPRVIASLQKYGLPFDDNESTEVLRDRLAQFYAKRTLTRETVDPCDCAEAILFLAGERSRRTTGHILPVDAGLVEAFLR